MIALLAIFGIAFGYLGLLITVNALIDLLPRREE